MEIKKTGIPQAWRITLKQFTQFLRDVGRTSNCPICPHRGEWRFYIDDAYGAGQESYMMLTMLTVVPPDLGTENIEHYGVYTMECPNCGYALHTSAHLVEKALARKEGQNG